MEAQVSIVRLEKFFASEEIDPYLPFPFCINKPIDQSRTAVSVDSNNLEPDVAIRISNGTFKWSSAETNTLNSI